MIPELRAQEVQERGRPAPGDDAQPRLRECKLRVAPAHPNVAGQRQFSAAAQRKAAGRCSRAQALVSGGGSRRIGYAVSPLGAALSDKAAVGQRKREKGATRDGKPQHSRAGHSTSAACTAETGASSMQTAPPTVQRKICLSQAHHGRDQAIPFFLAPPLLGTASAR